MTQFSMAKFQIAQLRQARAVSAVESIAVMLFALFVSAFLPQILVKYVYAGQQLTEEPALLTYIPIVAFVVGGLYFVAAALMNIKRMGQIKKMEKEMGSMMMDDGACCTNCVGNCQCDDHMNCMCGACEVKTEAMEKPRSPKKK